MNKEKHAFWRKYCNIFAHIRNFLEQNKVIFTTVAAIALSAMAIVISIQANSIAREQTRIAEQQTQILLQQQMPRIRLNLEYSNNYTEDKLIIYNDGLPLTSFDIERMFFLEISFSYNTENKTRREVLVPIDQYYGLLTLTQQPTGELASYKNVGKNIEKFNKIVQEIEKYTYHSNIVGSVQLRRVVRVTYQDIFKEIHSEYFYIDPGYGSIKLEESVGNYLYKLYESEWNENKLKLDEINPWLLKEKWDKLDSPEPNIFLFHLFSL